jgi:hypothetical protein
MRSVFCVAGIKSTFITIRKRFVQLDQDTAKLPSYFACTILLFSVCLVRQQTDKSSGCPYSGTVSRPAVLIAPSDLIK